MDDRSVKLQIVWLLPIFILVAIMPLIVFVDAIPQVVSDDRIFPIPHEFFTASKLKLLVLLGPLCLLCSFFSKYCTVKSAKQLIGEPVLYAVLVYLLFVVLSSVSSSFQDLAFYGITGRNEGMFAFLCYFCFWIAIWIQIRTEFQLKALLACFYFYIAISLVVGFSQFINQDILTWEGLMPFLIPQELRDAGMGFSKESASHYVYITLLNPNYVGTMMSLALMLCLSLYISTAKIKYKILHGVFASISLFLLVASSSRGGYISTLISMILLVIVFFKIIVQNWKSTLAILAVFALILFLADSYVNGSLSRQLTSTLDSLRIQKAIEPPVVPTITEEPPVASVTAEPTVVEQQEPVVLEQEPDSELPLATEPPSGVISQLLYDFDFQGNELTLVSSLGTIFVRIEGESLTFFNQDMRVLAHEKMTDDGIYAIITAGYDGLYLQWNDGNFTVFAINPLSFVYENGQLLLVDYADRRWDSKTPPVFAPLIGREAIMSSRGYIWSRSIPMIKDTLFLGYGPDTYVLYFPQHEFAMKQELFNNPSIFVDKPHNMFIQTALNTGLVSLIALLTAYGLYFYRLFRLILQKGLANKWVLYSACVTMGMVAYLISGLVNDSVIFIAPLFWVMFGIGCAANRNALEPVPYL